MSRKTLVVALFAILSVLGTSNQVDAWGGYHVGYTHVGYGGAYHVGATAGYGGDRYGSEDRSSYHSYGGYHYGGDRYGAYGAGVYRRY
jgi:hypothetical protein